MANVKLRLSVALCLFLGISDACGEVPSAKLIVETNEGAKTYEMYESGKMYFSNDFLVVEPISNGGSEAQGKAEIKLADIKKLLFSDLNASTGIIQNAMALEVYPNPATDYIAIQFASADTYPFTIFSAKGEKVKSGKTQSGEKIEVQSLPTGIYFLNIGNAYFKFSKL